VPPENLVRDDAPLVYVRGEGLRIRALGAITYYQGTARVAPITDGNRALLEWSVTFGCPGAIRGLFVSAGGWRTASPV